MNSEFDDEYEMAEAIGLAGGEEATATSQQPHSTSELQMRGEAVESATGALLEYQVQGLLEDAYLDPALLGAHLKHFLKGITAALQVHGQPQLVTSKTLAPVRKLLVQMGYDVEKQPVKYATPDAIKVVGLAALELIPRVSPPEIEVVVQLNNATFKDNDHLDHRYHAKRAVCLAEIASRLRSLESVQSVVWQGGSDPRSPALVVTPSTPLVEGTQLKLVVKAVPSASALSANKLAPSKNAIRTLKDKASSELPPTPAYNHSIIQDISCLPHEQHIQETLEAVPAFRSTVALLLCWARARALDYGADGLSPRFLTALALRAATSTPASGPVDIARAALVTVVTNKRLLPGSSKALALPRPRSGTRLSSGKASNGWRWPNNDAVVLDGATGCCNLAAGVSKGCLAAARIAAKATLSMLSSSTPEAFAAAFVSRSDTLSGLGDAWVRVKFNDGCDDSLLLAAYDLPPWRSEEHKALEIATRALGPRAKSVRLLPRYASDDVCAGPNTLSTVLAVRLDAAAALKPMDIGPNADDKPAARAFRAFWGPKSELRRFQDGRIAEAVVWAPAGAARHSVAERVLEYILPRHVPSITNVFTTLPSTALDGALGSNEEAEAAAVRDLTETAEKLSKAIRALQDPVLKITGTQLLDPAGRGTALACPRPHPLAGSANAALSADGRTTSTAPRCVPGIALLCSLEGSSKWPVQPEPYFQTKAAVACQLATLLSNTHGLFAEARTDATIDVLAYGHAFRLLLAADRDSQMLAAMAAVHAAKESSLEEDSASVQPFKLPPELDMAARTRHQGFISKLAAECPAFGPAVRLAKAWVAAHLLSNHLREEAIELVVAAAFSGVSAPSSRLTGFLGFLRLLAEHPWDACPLSTDTTQTSSRAASLPMDILAPGKGGATAPWTRDAPSRPVVKRLVVLARRAQHALQGPVLDDIESEPSAKELLRRLFASDLHECDAIIQLRSDAVPACEGAENLIRSLNPKQGPKTPPSAAAKKRRADDGMGNGITTTGDLLLPMPAGFEAEPVLLDECTAVRTKASRAVLSGIPLDVVIRRGIDSIRHELLVGFDPTKQYVQLLEKRLGDVAVVLADYAHSGRFVGIKWKIPALKAPGCPVSAAQLSGSQIHLEPASEDRMLGALCDAIFLGAGLVEGVALIRRTNVEVPTAEPKKKQGALDHDKFLKRARRNKVAA